MVQLFNTNQFLGSIYAFYSLACLIDSRFWVTALTGLRLNVMELSVHWRGGDNAKIFLV